jgi:hypothetical protein
LENKPRKPRDLTKNRHSDSLKRFNLKMKKEDDVAVDDDDDNVTRTRVSQQ